MIQRLQAEAAPPRGSTRELLRLAWPLILGQSFATLQILVDRILLSRAGGEAVGASMAAALLYWTPIALLQYTANYATTFVAQYTGAGQPRRVGPVVWQALYVSLAGGVAFLGLVPLAGPLVALVGHEPVLQELESTYFRCLCFAALPTLLTSSSVSFFAGRGDSRTVLLVNAVGLVVNGVGAYAWIYGQWGFPAWGIAGAGWAHVVGASVSALLALALMLRPRHELLHAVWSGRAFDLALMRRLLRFGVPNGVFTSLDGLAWTVFLVFVGRLGAAALSATTIALTLNLIVFLPMLGFGQAVEVLVGQRLGEGRPDLAERSVWRGVRLTLAATAAAAAALVLLPGPLAALFHSDRADAAWEEVGPLVPVLLRFVALYCLCDSLNVVFSFALRGAGDTRFVTAAGVGLAWPLLVLPSWAAWSCGWGLFWAWGFASFYIMALAAVFFVRFRQGKWRSMRVIEAAQAAE
jgi:MATE family multidrug resistance protein